MFSTRRFFLFTAVTITLGAGTLVGFSTVPYFSLPHPSDANRDQLFRWLVLRDIESQPKDLQMALVQRLEEELADGVPEQSEGSLNFDQNARLATNIAVLQRLWFEFGVEEYAELDVSQQAEFLDHKLKTINRWPDIEQLVKVDPTESPQATRSSVSDFFDHLQRTITNASQPQQTQMIHVVHDGTIRWLATGDLESISMEDRRNLADRIVRNMTRNDSNDRMERLIGAQQLPLIRRNIELLIEAHFHNQVSEYFELPSADRNSFVDEQIELLLELGVFDLLSDGPIASDHSTKTLDFQSLIVFARTANGWLERAEPAQRERMAKVIAHAQQRILSRQFGGTN